MSQILETSADIENLQCGLFSAKIHNFVTFKDLKETHEVQHAKKMFENWLSMTLRLI